MPSATWGLAWAVGLRLVKDATAAQHRALCLAVGPLVTAIAVVLAGHDRRLERIPPRL